MNCWCDDIESYKCIDCESVEKYSKLNKKQKRALNKLDMAPDGTDNQLQLSALQECMEHSVGMEDLPNKYKDRY